MIPAFITIRFLDIIDIFLVAFLLYKLYLAIRGTAAFNIFMGIFIFYIIWIVVKGLNMELMGSLMGQLMTAGVLALIVVFQQEIRKFLLLLGSRYNLFNKGFSIEKLFSREHVTFTSEQVKKIVTACEAMSRTKTGALIVLTNEMELEEYIETGEKLNAEVSVALLESLFFKNSPLHDGAVIIQRGTIVAAHCVLPITNKRLRNAQLGLRHRAALGMSQETDAFILVVSEETGGISYALNGKLHEDVNPIELPKLIEKVYQKNNNEPHK